MTPRELLTKSKGEADRWRSEFEKVHGRWPTTQETFAEWRRMNPAKVVHQDEDAKTFLWFLDFREKHGRSPTDDEILSEAGRRFCEPKDGAP